ncbi:MAG TPA: haloalkane dehalogenase [Polyangiaceae bacterium]|nr:haloalkane dehalogenase [Polyangiaceae bacterium]
MLNPSAPASTVTSSSASSSSRQVPVLESFMAVREVGSGPPIVFLHGNPLSSQVWHDVLPRLSVRGRCVAPDLIGMGDSGKPNLAYRLEDHARYLDAWFEAMGLQDAVLVGYDWGGVLAMDWAARHPERVRGLVVFETFLRPMTWSEWSPRGAELFRGLRTPGVGEKMVLESNLFLDRSLANGIKRPLTEAERAAYYAPYEGPASRRPILQWTREIPIEGEPADVHAIFARYDAWLAASPGVPKLLLSFDAPEGLQPSPTGSAPMIDWARTHVSSLEITHVGTAAHHAPEDLPEPVASAIGDWLIRHAL